jgi:hypothetical protein
MTTNAFLPPKVFANAGLKLLKNSLVISKLVDSEGVDKVFQPGIGGTVYVKRPPEFIVRRGATATPQNVIEGEVAVNINIQSGVDVQFTSVEETLNVDKLLQSKVLAASMATMASDIDGVVMAQTLGFNNWVGTPGTTMSSPTSLFAAAQRLDENAIPVDGRDGVLTPGDTYGVAGSLLSNAAQQGSIAGNALEKAKVPVIGNVDWYMTQTVPGLTTGTRTTSAAAQINGAAQNVAYTAVKSSMQQTLVLKTIGNGATVVAGEVFTIAAVNDVNPRNKTSQGRPKQFTVVTGGTADGSGNLTITIFPAIISDNTSPYQNVDAAPANSANVTWLGAASTTYRAGAAFHKTAIKLVSAKLVMPYSGESDYATDPETGLTVRYWRYSDGANDLHNHRWDVLFNAVNTDPRLGTRVSA